MLDRLLDLPNCTDCTEKTASVTQPDTELVMVLEIALQFIA